MTATQRAMLISLFVMSISLGISMLNEINSIYEGEMGQPLVRINATTYLNDGQYGTSGDIQEFNSTMNDIGEFNKPDNIAFDFSFWQSIKLLKILGETFIYAVWGFPFFLQTYFGMPQLLTLPMLIFINISHILFGAYVILGKSF